MGRGSRTPTHGQALGSLDELLAHDQAQQQPRWLGRANGWALPDSEQYDTDRERYLRSWLAHLPRQERLLCYDRTSGEHHEIAYVSGPQFAATLAAVASGVYSVAWEPRLGDSHGSVYRHTNGDVVTSFYSHEEGTRLGPEIEPAQLRDQLAHWRDDGVIADLRQRPSALHLDQCGLVLDEHLSLTSQWLGRQQLNLEAEAVALALQVVGDVGAKMARVTGPNGHVFAVARSEQWRKGAQDAYSLQVKTGPGNGDAYGWQLEDETWAEVQRWLRESTDG